MDATDLAALAGTLQVRPGGPLPTVRSTRHGAAARIGVGVAAQALPERMALLHRLCGGAHRVAAGHAVAAAVTGRSVVDSAAAQALQADTLREHLRRLWLDAPALLGDAHAPSVAELGACPLARHGDTVDDVSQRWIEDQVLGGGAAEWLAAWDDDAVDAAARWAARGATWPARALAAWRARLGDRAQPVRGLAVHASPEGLHELAAALRADPGFVHAPVWHAEPAETGSWTRLAAPRPIAPPLWLRHAARVAEVARLAAPGGDRWLAQGGLSTGIGEGLGWCEMARGLLVHWLRVDAAGRVADCRVLAPTEWNFHPGGSAAQALAGLPRHAGEGLVRALVAAYDPCVEVQAMAEVPGA